MGEQADFIRAWRVWLRRDLPTENFRRCRGKATTYQVELDLDHLVTSVYTTVQGFLDNRGDWDHTRRVGDYLEQLHRMEMELDSCPAPATQVHRIRDFIGATRAVLHTFVAWVRAREQA